jgi:hypothetical protein
MIVLVGQGDEGSRVASDLWWREVGLVQDRLESIVGAWGGRFTVGQLREAISARSWSMVDTILNEAWFRAPEVRDIMEVPGFARMCDLLDGTVARWPSDEGP